ncbi:hypothetical protein [Pseudidiomarina salilacus]|uniref:hypothetical protein n=1 Tax=Pseudidiomarina salilacus TaxID=3384452 RepID=UPI00398555BB
MSNALRVALVALSVIFVGSLWYQASNSDKAVSDGSAEAALNSPRKVSSSSEVNQQAPLPPAAKETTESIQTQTATTMHVGEYRDPDDLSNEPERSFKKHLGETKDPENVELRREGQRVVIGKIIEDPQAHVEAHRDSIKAHVGREIPDPLAWAEGSSSASEVRRSIGEAKNPSVD